MLIIDLLIAAAIVGAAIWGYQRGLLTRALALVGFGAGAILGSRIAPLVLDGGLRDPFAPVLALPAALLCGALAGMMLERFGFRLRRRLPRRGKANAVGGAVLAGLLGLVTVWILGALAARVDNLKEPVRDSAIIEKLNAALPPPGPLLSPEKRTRFDSLPQLTGPSPNVGPADPTIRRDPQVRAAAASVAKIHVDGCEGGGGTGSGWIARDGVVVTNAHVVDKAREVGVQLRGKGETYDAAVIWFDEVNDIAVLRTPDVSGVPALRIGPDPKAGTYSAALGYPGGGPYTLKPARTGEVTRDPALKVEGKALKVKVIPFRAVGVKPGSSGGPIVDRDARVRGMIFAGKSGGNVGVAVPIKGIRRALRRADAPVNHGDCG